MLQWYFRWRIWDSNPSDVLFAKQIVTPSNSIPHKYIIKGQLFLCISYVQELPYTKIKYLIYVDLHQLLIQDGPSAVYQNAMTSSCLISVFSCSDLIEFNNMTFLLFFLLTSFISVFSRCNVIWTHSLFTPNEADYQVFLHTDMEQVEGVKPSSSGWWPEIINRYTIPTIC